MRRKNPNEILGTSYAVTVNVSAIGLRPPAAAARIGTSPFHIEELMRDGALPFRIVGGARVIAIEDLDSYFASIPKQNGKLPGRGRFLESAAA